jgi:hypothetical protein
MNGVAGAGEIHLHHAQDLVRPLAVAAAMPAADPGVGDDEVEGRLVVDRRDPAGDPRFVRRVEQRRGHHAAGRPAAFRHLGKAPLVAAGERQADAGSGIAQRQRRADAAAGAGDEDRPRGPHVPWSATVGRRGNEDALFARCGRRSQRVRNTVSQRPGLPKPSLKLTLLRR